MTAPRLCSAALLALVAALAACGHESRAAVAAASERSTGSPAEANAGSPKTLPARPNPCDFVPATDAARIVGPLAGSAWQAASADDTTAAADGTACVYPLAPRDGVPAGSAVVLGLETETATTFEQGLAMVQGTIARQVGPGVAGGDAPDTSADARQALDGWDYLGAVGPMVQGRIGGLGVLASHGDAARVAGDSLLRLLTLMRDRIPDLPFAAYGEGHVADEGDTCALITRAEVEAVLGPLAMPPYHSRDATPLADPTGTGCSFYTGKHRVFSIEARWSLGKRLYPMLVGMQQTLEAKTGAPSASTDTLEGPWDQAGSNIAGQLYFLKGDRLLTVSYRTSKTDLAGAVRLARKAVERLAS